MAMLCGVLTASASSSCRRRQARRQLGDQRRREQHPLLAAHADQQVQRRSQLQVAWTYDSARRLQGLRDAEQPHRRRRRALCDDADDEGGGGGRGDRRGDLEVRSRAAARTARTRFRHRGVAVHADRVFVTYRNFSDRARQDDRPADRVVRRRTAASICAKGSAVPPRGLSVSASTPGVVFEDLLILPAAACPKRCPARPGTSARST